MSTKMSEPGELFLHRLGDVLCAERTLVKTLPTLQEEGRTSSSRSASRSISARRST